MFSFSEYREDLPLQQLRSLDSLGSNEIACCILIKFMNYRWVKWSYREGPGLTLGL